LPPERPIRSRARSDRRRNVVDLRPHLPPPCPELDCVRRRLPRATVERAERRAAELATGADRVLIAEGAIAEETYVAALAASLGLRHEVLDHVPRTSCPLDDEQLLDAASAGILPLIEGDDLVWIVAPRNLAARSLARRVPRDRELKSRLRLTSAAQIDRFVAVYGCHAQGRRAEGDLHAEWPDLSARPGQCRLSPPVAAIALVAPAALVLWPTATMVAVEAILAAGFVSWLLLRFIGSFVALPAPPPTYIPDGELPVYSVIVALYREARAVDGLIDALRDLDYPPEKLQILIAIEADDHETWRALSRLRLTAPFEVVTVPNVGPRTKPKALNAALPFARGTFTAVYDAEDRPEADQLRRVLTQFRSGGDDLACVQGCLTIDNTADGWLARMFTAEYAAQFDLFLPGLAALGVPLPLGGSSNHFRTAVLREIGAWDPYNVTEDADLGVRLARFGYRTTVVRSTTYEEAPARIGPWLRQRTRWFKGWIKTWMVHMRHPLRLLRELGPLGFVCFQLVVGGSVLAALIHPLFLAAVAVALASGGPVLGANGHFTGTLVWLYGTSLGAGYFVSIFLGWRGLARRGLVAHAWVLALVPVHWLLLSLAAWRAAFQLVRDPHGWEKTEHGLAATSRRAKRTGRALLHAFLRPDERAPRREAAE
jgi:cellulose synthase/poly-beta-1,6-N-acetylglucosamine synthase-like glycosyltransferase